VNLYLHVGLKVFPVNLLVPSRFGINEIRADDQLDVGDGTHHAY